MSLKDYTTFELITPSSDTDSSLQILITGVIPKSLPVLSTEPVLRKVAVDREIGFSTEQYGCRQRNDNVLMPARGVILGYASISFLLRQFLYYLAILKTLKLFWVAA